MQMLTKLSRAAKTGSSDMNGTEESLVCFSFLFYRAFFSTERLNGSLLCIKSFYEHFFAGRGCKVSLTLQPKLVFFVFVT